MGRGNRYGGYGRLCVDVCVHIREVQCVHLCLKCVHVCRMVEDLSGRRPLLDVRVVTVTRLVTTFFERPLLNTYSLMKSDSLPEEHPCTHFILSNEYIHIMLCSYCKHRVALLDHQD